MADTSARRFKGNPKETDWWPNHSYEGWDSDEPPPTNPVWPALSQSPEHKTTT